MVLNKRIPFKQRMSKELIMPSLELIFTLLMLPAVFLLAASVVVSLIENNREQSLADKQAAS